MTEKFQKAYLQTMGHEGGYVDDPDDAGAETYKGVSRRYHPSWPGWVLIDRAKGRDDFPNSLTSDSYLHDMIKAFYKEQYWDRFWGDKVSDESLALAFELFDTSVNMGVHRAVIFIQKALNYLNRNGMLYDDIVEDGQFGPGTLSVLKKYMKTDQASYIIKIANLLQGGHYLEYMKKSPGQEKYARGWLNRVSL